MKGFHALTLVYHKYYLVVELQGTQHPWRLVLISVDLAISSCQFVFVFFIGFILKSSVQYLVREDNPSQIYANSVESIQFTSLQHASGANAREEWSDETHQSRYTCILCHGLIIPRCKLTQCSGWWSFERNTLQAVVSRCSQGMA